jgi:hypothetical protein
LDIMIDVVFGQGALLARRLLRNSAADYRTNFNGHAGSKRRHEPLGIRKTTQLPVAQFPVSTQA